MGRSKKEILNQVSLKLEGFSRVFVIDGAGAEILNSSDGGSQEILEELSQSNFQKPAPLYDEEMTFRAFRIFIETYRYYAWVGSSLR